MSDDMSSSWKYLNSASSRFSAVKGYMQRRNNPQTQSWKEWAGQKIKLGRGQSGYQASDTERITLFPGWATRRYVDGKETFGIDVFVSGFASNHRPAEQASRSQRAFIRLAKGFASLPKLAADVIAPDPPSSISQSTQDLLAQIPENYDVQFIEREFQRTKAGSTPSTDILEPEIYKRKLPDSHSQSAADILRRQHDNLERRLQPFWSSVLPSRTVRIRLFASLHHPTADKDQDHPAYTPIDSQDVVTAADGSFQALFRLKWSSLCQHPGALHIAFGDPREEHELHLSAELLPPLSPSPSRTPTPRYPSTVPSILQISLTHSPIRVISDIDDTVKLSNILLGARAVFNSVFVKDLHETIIPGMGEWYTTMWSRGVRFHYVSNGPFEILPIINEFLHISQLPPGSIRLKSYAGRSLFNGILSAPATRKRAGVVDVLTAFPDSQFFLIGDSGEQDLELYADLARERPQQILAVFIRDADNTYPPIDDPTGWKAVGASGIRSHTQTLFSSKSGSGSTADDNPRLRKTLSDMLLRSTATTTTSSSKAPALLSPPTFPFPSSGSLGSTNINAIYYFSPTHLTDEPESDPTLANTSSPTSPSNPSSPSNPKTKTKIKIKTKTKTRSPSPIPPMSPYTSTYAYPHPPHSHPGPPRAPSLLSRSSASSLASRISTMGGMSDAERKRCGLQMRVYRARTQMPGHVLLRVFRDPGECVEVEEVLKGAGGLG